MASKTSYHRYRLNKSSSIVKYPDSPCWHNQRKLQRCLHEAPVHGLFSRTRRDARSVGNGKYNEIVRISGSVVIQNFHPESNWKAETFIQQQRCKSLWLTWTWFSHGLNFWQTSGKKSSSNLRDHQSAQGQNLSPGDTDTNTLATPTLCQICLWWRAGELLYWLAVQRQDFTVKGPLAKPANIYEEL